MTGPRLRLHPLGLLEVPDRPTPEPLRVLITSASRKISLVRAVQGAVQRLSPGGKVIAGDLDPQALSRYVADAFWTMPRTTDASLEDLLEECAARGIRAILPTRDGELAFWARHRERLAEAGIAVIVADLEAVERCLDKFAFSDWGGALDLPLIPAGIDPDAFGDRALVAKERFGAGSRGLGLNLRPGAAARHGATLEHPIYQPFVDGLEISIDAWMTSAGSVHGLVLRRRDWVIGGESQVTTTFRDPEIEREAAAVLEALGLRGPAVMQAILTEAGISVIEVNPRFGGASTASLAVGLDTLYWSLYEAVKPNQPLPSFARLEGDVRLVRLPEDTIIHDPDL